jgi:glyoxylase-like metal-dependent hydrolase (beta-lactamase superfamily II)
MKRILFIIGAFVALIIAVLFLIGRSSYNKFMQVEAVPIDKNLTVYLGGGGNSVVLTSDDGNQALIVDTKMNAAAKTLASSVKAGEVTIVNTHYHRDHVDGNHLYPGATLIAGAYAPEQWKAMAASSKYPDRVVKPGQDTVLRIAGETVRVRNMGRAHSWDDVVVYLENRKILVTGDVVFNHRNPALFTQGGTNVAAWVAVIDSLLVRFDPVKVIPGHGLIADKSALVDAKEYFVSISHAIGNPEKMAAVREKYKDYPNLPMMADFDRTVKFIEEEMKGK